MQRASLSRRRSRLLHSIPRLSQRHEPDADADQPVKLTVRLRRGVAVRLATRARACGLSHGTYLATLIDGTPAPPLAVVAALNASTDQLAVVSADLNEVIRAAPRAALALGGGTRPAHAKNRRRRAQASRSGVARGGRAPACADVSDTTPDPGCKPDEPVNECGRRRRWRPRPMGRAALLSAQPHRPVGADATPVRQRRANAPPRFASASGPRSSGARRR